MINLLEITQSTISFICFCLSSNPKEEYISIIWYCFVGTNLKWSQHNCYFEIQVSGQKGMQNGCNVLLYKSLNSLQNLNSEKLSTIVKWSFCFQDNRIWGMWSIKLNQEIDLFNIVITHKLSSIHW